MKMIQRGELVGRLDQNGRWLVMTIPVEEMAWARRRAENRAREGQEPQRELEQAEKSEACPRCRTTQREGNFPWLVGPTRRELLRLIRMTRRHGLGGTKLGASVRRIVFERDQFICHICREPTDAADPPAVDHIIPLFLGGTEADDNRATRPPLMQRP